MSSQKSNCFIFISNFLVKFFSLHHNVFCLDFDMMLRSHTKVAPNLFCIFHILLMNFCKFSSSPRRRGAHRSSTLIKSSIQVLIIIKRFYIIKRLKTDNAKNFLKVFSLKEICGLETNSS